MLAVKICVGSSCYLKGAQELVEMFQTAIKENNIEGKVELSGSLCAGRCNRYGVTVHVDGITYTGITKENFNEFFKDYILKRLGAV